ncbi:MAG: hypothetical protein QW320_00325 [Ignisphaera sp.]
MDYVRRIVRKVRCILGYNKTVESLGISKSSLSNDPHFFVLSSLLISV